jgi:hypothetical protein
MAYRSRGYQFSGANSTAQAYEQTAAQCRLSVSGCVSYTFRQLWDKPLILNEIQNKRQTQDQANFLIYQQHSG